MEIYLHCPVYAGRKPSREVEDLCRQVWYYERPANWRSLSIRYPYMVFSRRNPRLLKHLLQDEYPIFFDGINASYYLSHPLLSKRIKLFRPHNVEQDYFRLMSEREQNPFRKAYYYTESLLLRSYEEKLSASQAFFPIAAHDYAYFCARFPEKKHVWVPAFHPYDSVQSLTGTGLYCIYHGNMAHAENQEAVLFLLKEVIPGIPYPFIIAGRNPGEEICQLADSIPHCRLIPNPDIATMSRLIQEAHIQVLPTFQSTGLKLKLLHALFNGRHVLVNPQMLTGTALLHSCQIAGDARDFQEKIHLLMNTEFSLSDKMVREETLAVHYDNRKNAAKIISCLRELLP